MTTTNDSGQQRPSTTSAKRLYDLLVEVRNRSGATINTILVDIFFSNSGDARNRERLTIDAQRVIAEMIDEYERELDNAHITQAERELYFEPILAVTRVLHPGNTSAPLATGKQAIVESDLHALKHIDVRMRPLVNEKELTKDDFADLISSLDEALVIVRSSELPDDLKDFIAAQLLKVKDSIEQYRFRGMRGVKDALAGYIGALGMGGGAIGEKLDDKAKLSLKTVIDRGNSVITLARGAVWVWPHLAQGVETIRKALGV